MDTAAIVTCVRNFPHHRGSIVGASPLQRAYHICSTLAKTMIRRWRKSSLIYEKLSIDTPSQRLEVAWPPSLGQAVRKLIQSDCCAPRPFHAMSN